MLIKQTQSARHSVADSVYNRCGVLCVEQDAVPVVLLAVVP